MALVWWKLWYAYCTYLILFIPCQMELADGQWSRYQNRGGREGTVGMEKTIRASECQPTKGNHICLNRKKCFRIFCTPDTVLDTKWKWLSQKEACWLKDVHGEMPAALWLRVIWWTQKGKSSWSVGAGCLELLGGEVFSQVIRTLYVSAWPNHLLRNGMAVVGPIICRMPF